MTKKQEIEAWEVLLNTLTEDSYTFGYVVNQLPFIKEAIRLDIHPDTYGMTMEEYHQHLLKEAKDIYATAEAEAQDIVCKAKAQAELIEAQKNSAYEDAHVALRSVIQKLELVAERL
jgi:hypothetical protein